MIDVKDLIDEENREFTSHVGTSSCAVTLVESGRNPKVFVRIAKAAKIQDANPRDAGDSACAGICENVQVLKGQEQVGQGNAKGTGMRNGTRPPRAFPVLKWYSQNVALG